MVCHNCESSTTPGYALCAMCVERLQKAISYCVDAWDPLQAIAAKKAAAVPDGGGPHSARAFAPLPCNPAALEASYAVAAVAHESAHALGANPTKAAAALLYCKAEAVRLARMSGEEADAAYYLSRWEDAAAAARRVISPPEDAARQFIGGICEACGGAMVSANNGRTLVCRRCGKAASAQKVRVRAAQAMHAPQGKATPAEAERVFARGGVRLPSATIRSWVRRGKLEPDDAGRVELAAVYRLVADTAPAA